MIIYFVALDNIGCVLGIILNVLLALAAYNRKLPNVQHFAYMVFVCSIYDITYAIVILLSHHEVQVIDQKLLIIPFGLEPYVPRIIGNIISMVEYFFLIYSTAIIPVQFYYRYYLITTSEIHSRRRTLELFKAMAIAAVLTLPIPILSHLTHQKAFQRPMSYYSSMLDPKMFPNGAIFVYADDFQDIEALLMMGFGFVHISMCYAASLYFAVKSFKGVNVHGLAKSVKTDRLRRQFARSLVAQSINGLLLAELPMLMVIVMLFSGANLAIPSAVIMLCASWTSFMNALVTFIIIKPYLHFVINRSQGSSGDVTSHNRGNKPSK